MRGLAVYRLPAVRINAPRRPIPPLSQYLPANKTKGNLKAARFGP